MSLYTNLDFKCNLAGFDTVVAASTSPHHGEALNVEGVSREAVLMNAQVQIGGVCRHKH